MQTIVDLYKKTYGVEPSHIAALPKAGSNRLYYRITNAKGETLIGVVGTSLQENQTFVYLAKHFRKAGINVPKIITENEATCSYLIEDLGRTSLYDLLCDVRNNNTDEAVFKQLFVKVIQKLAHLQIKGAEQLDVNKLLSPRFFDEESIMFDLNYFKYCFLKPTDISFDEVLLEHDFRDFARMLTSISSMNQTSFLYRDFQARNIMIHEGEPYFIDFQGGMIGPPHYDLVSLLWQASAEYSEDFRKEMIEIYVSEMNKYAKLDERLFKEQLNFFVLFRTIQVLGAYGLRGYFEKKPYFLNSIPKAIKNLQILLQKGFIKKYEYLELVLQKLVNRLLDNNVTESQSETGTVCIGDVSNLHVSVFSFSYKKTGVPHDESGNGGGYVFDCRSIHNPGKYEPYKTLTGLDQPVVDFLEKDGAILNFLTHVYSLADAHVATYLERGFTDLMFSFGCTGGQHRSVYAAQHLAEYLHKKYQIKVTLEHIEQHIVQEFPMS